MSESKGSISLEAFQDLVRKIADAKANGSTADLFPDLAGAPPGVDSSSVPIVGGQEVVRAGSGAFADVYRVYSITLSTFVSVKVFKKNKLADSAGDFVYANYFRSNRWDPNSKDCLMKIFSTPETEKKGVIIAEYCGRGDLARLSKTEDMKKFLSLERVMGLFSALVILNDILKVAHGDMKPENILVRIDGSLVICDFGAMVPINNTDQGLGSFSYVAPEIFDYNYDRSNVDIWSLGLTLCKLLTDRNPFEEIIAAQNFSNKYALVTFMCKMLGSSSREARLFERKLGEISKTIPDSSLKEIITSMLAVNPKARPAAKDILNKYEKSVAAIQKQNETVNDSGKGGDGDKMEKTEEGSGHSTGQEGARVAEEDAKKLEKMPNDSDQKIVLLQTMENQRKALDSFSDPQKIQTPPK
ncbi:MAG: protein kinase [Rickettsiales bacterium]|jgi:serine/threonine protein kinase|nr:protein kinase [Rickettsiales bacterium]